MRVAGSLLERVMKLAELIAQISSGPVFLEIGPHAAYPNFTRVALARVKYEEGDECFFVGLRNLNTKIIIYYRDIGMEDGVRLWVESYWNPTSREFHLARFEPRFQVRGIDFDAITDKTPEKPQECFCRR